MTAREQADTLVLTLNIWRFLQYCDQMIAKGDKTATDLVGSHFSSRGWSLDQAVRNNWLPFMRLQTTISILHITLFFARSMNEDLWIESMKGPRTYDISCSGPKCPKAPNIYQVVRVMRNAIAHEFDEESAGGSVSFPSDGFVSFSAKEGVVTGVTFGTTEGMAGFLEDFVSALQKVANTTRSSAPSTVG